MGYLANGLIDLLSVKIIRAIIYDEGLMDVIWQGEEARKDPFYFTTRERLGQCPYFLQPLHITNKFTGKTVVLPFNQVMSFPSWVSLELAIFV